MKIMTVHLSARNERRNRRRAAALTFLVTFLIMAGVLYAGSPELQSLLDQWINEVLGTSPQAGKIQP